MWHHGNTVWCHAVWPDVKWNTKRVRDVCLVGGRQAGQPNNLIELITASMLVGTRIRLECQMNCRPLYAWNLIGVSVSS